MKYVMEFLGVKGMISATYQIVQEKKQRENDKAAVIIQLTLEQHRGRGAEPPHSQKSACKF